MLDKETFREELIRMWDSLRAINKGERTCISVKCEECPFHLFCSNGSPGEDIYRAFDIIEIVEKWSKRNPPKKYKVSQLEYDILKSFKESNLYSKFYFNSSLITRNLLKLGYFEGADDNMKICDYLNDCEVEDE